MKRTEQEKMSEAIWRNWDKDSRINFLLDHKDLLEHSIQIDTITSNENYYSLPANIKKILRDNIDFGKEEKMIKVKVANQFWKELDKDMRIAFLNDQQNELGIPKNEFDGISKLEYEHIPQSIKTFILSKIEKMEDKKLSADVNKFSKKELEYLADFINRRDFGKNTDIIVIKRDEKFIEGEVIVLYKNELFYRGRQMDKVTIANENLGTEKKMKMEWDEAVSLRKKDIAAISVSRPSICECPSCNEKRNSGEHPKQPDYFELEIFNNTPKVLYIRIAERDLAFYIQEYLREWAFGKNKK